MNTFVTHPPQLTGTVRTGVGQGADFTGLDWARAQFIEHCGIDPYPGTLNLAVEEPEQQAIWAGMRRSEAFRVRPPQADACDADLLRVGLRGSRATDTTPTLTAAVVVPDVPGYPRNQIELIAAVDIRDFFGLADGDTLHVELLCERRIDAMIFDVDGTLLNSLDGYRLAASRATAAFGYDVTLDHVRRALDTNQPFWNFVVPDGESSSAERIAELRAATMRHWPDALEEVVRVLPGVAEALEQLRSAGVRLAIFTGSGGESFPPLRDAGLLDLFEIVITGNDVERRKPDPQGIQHCLERLGIAPGQAAYVGDSCIDVQASKTAGVCSVGVLTGAGTSASLTAAGADLLVAHAADVPGLLALTAGPAE